MKRCLTYWVIISLLTHKTSKDMKTNMRILYITYELPYFTGGGMPIRDYHLIRNLSKTNQITVVAYDYDDPEMSQKKKQAMKPFCERVISIPPNRGVKNRWEARWRTIVSIVDPMPWPARALTTRRMHDTIRDLLKNTRFDIVQVNHVEMGGLLGYADKMKKVIGIEAITPKLERSYALQKKPLARLSYYSAVKQFPKYERGIYQKADLCTMASETEKETVLSLYPKAKVSVIPNGVDTSFFPFEKDDHKNIVELPLLFIGSMAYQPNEDAILFFLNQVWPELCPKYPQIKLNIIGRDPTPAVQKLAGDSVQVSGWVDDVRPYFNNSSVLIVPLRSGGGTRLKILEAMACGLPVVSTRIGAEGLDITDGENILLADEVDDFAEAILRLFNDQELMNRLRWNGRRLVEEKYEWKLIANKLEESYRRLFEQV